MDESPGNREILTVLLRSWNMRTTEATAAAALQTLDAAQAAGDPFRIAVLDPGMPGLGGESLARAIKANPVLGHTRLVACVAPDRQGGDARWKRVGVAGALTKPVRLLELRRVLLAVIKGGPTTKFPPTLAPVLARKSGWRRGRILVAEDNIANQQVAVGILGKLGLRADVAANGAEALKALETIPYDLVFMDVQMPEMDGLQATRRIRASESAVLDHRVPIVAMTAHAFQSDRDQCLQAGMDDYVTKPVELPALVAVLEKWFQAKDQGTQPIEQEVHSTVKPVRQDAPPVFDRAAVTRRMMHDNELIRMVIDGFLQELPGQIDGLERSLTLGDARAVAKLAHRIKGASATVGGEALRAAAAALELAANEERLDTATALMSDFTAQSNALKMALRAFPSARMRLSRKGDSGTTREGRCAPPWPHLSRDGSSDRRMPQPREKLFRARPVHAA